MTIKDSARPPPWGYKSILPNEKNDWRDSEAPPRPKVWTKEWGAAGPPSTWKKDWGSPRSARGMDARRRAGIAAKDRERSAIAARTKTTLIQVGMFANVADAFFDLGEGEPIEGGLTITGHNYWVIVEYGSSPRTPNAGPASDDPIILALPPGIPDSKGWAERYPIEPRVKLMLRFFWKGHWRRTFLVHHPGVLGRGFLRKYIANVVASLTKELATIFDAGEGRGEDDTIPSRKELVELVNFHLKSLLDAVVEATPISANGVDDDGNLRSDAEREERDGTHLRDAWGITRAKAGRSGKF